ncbi:MAG TPA: hypothetical protein VNF45_07180 [Candidatus Binataceae bacterium]|nr:hypothetical protein [Candidatus Binataceae bacterium]
MQSVHIDDPYNGYRLCSRLEIEWRARDIHPWDSGVALERRAAMFVEQSLSDAIFQQYGSNTRSPLRPATRRG